MDKKQLKMLKYLYNDPKTKEQIKKRFCMDDKAIREYFLNEEMRKYLDLKTSFSPEVWDGVFEIKPSGRSRVEADRHRLFNDVRAWITAAIAVAAFIKSFFF